MRNLRRVLMRLMRLLRRNNLVSPMHSHGRICRHRIVMVLPSVQGLITRWLSLVLPQRPPRKRTSPPSLDVREYVHIYISHTNKLSLATLSHVGGNKVLFWFVVGLFIWFHSTSVGESCYKFPICSTFKNRFKRIAQKHKVFGGLSAFGIWPGPSNR